MKKIRSLRPQDKSAKNWSPTGRRQGYGPAGPIGAADITFEWIVQGCTAKSFWTAPWRWITELEDRLRCQVQGHNTLAGPIESE